MFKAMILLTKKPEMTAEEFRHWLLDEHAPLAATLPGLRGLTYNIAQSAEPVADGIAELWFDTEQAFVDAYATEIGKSVAADSLSHVAARVRVFVAERVVVG
ncbi:MAG: EthD family reductase [Chloroflexi bacterium]|jgi:uncharacterized protein (TIGR02118 family)|nr:EthD family reductase [Chloroflexota bacterium]